MLVKITEQELMRAGTNKLSFDIGRTVMAAAAGRLNALFWGAIGTPKYYLANLIHELQPPLGACQPRFDEGSYEGVPIRNPHASITLEGMFGGGENLCYGEVTRAHNGVLLLSEAPEFKSSVLQMLSVVMNGHNVTLSRAGRDATYPADFQLVMTANSCPCGGYGNKERVCLCSARSIKQYWKKMKNVAQKCQFVIDCDIFGQDQAFNFDIEQMMHEIDNAIAFDTENSREETSDWDSFENAENRDCLDKLQREKNWSDKRLHCVWKAARWLANLDRSVFVKLRHIEEAAMYQPPVVNEDLLEA
ncbi:MAG: ATP-binding protein [Treponema sp.]|nr:ATP-binding protein [Treponema sp.]